VKELAFSGGVWQNALLVDLAIDVLGEKFSLHFHEKFHQMTKISVSDN
jgi:hydrogenase maturation protein HypF